MNSATGSQDEEDKVQRMRRSAFQDEIRFRGWEDQAKDEEIRFRGIGDQVYQLML